MKRNFKPNAEKLEDRMLMSAVTEELYGNFHFVPAAEKPSYSAIAFVGGWGASSYQYAFNDPNLGTANGGVWKATDSGASFGGQGRDLLLGGAGQDFETALNHGVSVLAWARVDGARAPMLFQALTSNEQATLPVPDNVWVDGTIITGQNELDGFDFASPPPGDNAVVGGNINVYFHVIRNSSTVAAPERYSFAFDGNGASLDTGHGTHPPGTIAAIGNNSALAEHEVGHWMSFAPAHEPAVESGIRLKGQTILQNAPVQGLDPFLEGAVSRDVNTSAEPLPVLLVIANRDFAGASAQLKDSGHADAGDGVVVDGRIITAENFDSAS